MATSQSHSTDVPSSPEDGGNFRRSLQIDMKGLVGDAVGNVSRHASRYDWCHRRGARFGRRTEDHDWWLRGHCCDVKLT